MSEVVLMADPRVTEVPVQEIDEPLVDARELESLFVDPQRDTGDGAFAHVRRELAQRLETAHGLLPHGYRLGLVEGYRPYALQEQYFSDYRGELVTARPDLSEPESYRLASRYVAPPPVAPHVSGAAVDLVLLDADGRLVDMGSPINATPESSAGACYFAADNVSAEARQHRQLLAAALGEVGLVNYPTEWWHWSYGDRYWAFVTEQPAALYGPVCDVAAASRRCRPQSQ
ncbi:MAG TPA: M15 family metallopeptidase [Nocardioidaceae bacterium]|nr:M15 family metallopeptidase [Nocardioidaceae bacterium]